MPSTAFPADAANGLRSTLHAVLDDNLVHDNESVQGAAALALGAYCTAQYTEVGSCVAWKVWLHIRMESTAVVFLAIRFSNLSGVPNLTMLPPPPTPLLKSLPQHLCTWGMSSG